MIRPVQLLFVSEGPAPGGATAAAVGGDPGIDIVARIEGSDAAMAALAGYAIDAILLYASEPGGPSRARLQRAASENRVPLILVEAYRAPVESYAALRRRVRAACGRDSDAPAPAPPARQRPPPRPRGAPKLIAIGASTGGVDALVKVLSRFPADCPPTVVVQHMPSTFTTSFAARLDGLCAPTVAEAWDAAPLDRGTVYVAPGGAAHLEVVWTAARRVRLVESAPVNRHRPSVDVAFHSVAQQLGAAAVGVLLTGMGRDGAQGLLAMRKAGARTIAQDMQSSTVFGMPRAAIEIRAVDRGTPLDQITAAVFSSEAEEEEVVSWR